MLPQLIGAAERNVQTFRNAMKAMGLICTRNYNDSCSNTGIHCTTTGLTPSELFLGRHVRTRLSMLRPEVSERIRVKQKKQMLAGPQATREFLEGDGKRGMVIAKCDYQVQVGAHVWHRHADQMRPDHVTAKRPTRSVDVKRSNSTAIPNTTTGFYRVN